MPDQTGWDAYNSLLLNGGLDRLTKLLARYELFKRVIDLPGDIVEGGVFKGSGVLYWAKLIQIFNPLSRRKVIGFDTFDGFPEAASHQYETERATELVRESAYEPISPEEIMLLAQSQTLDPRVELVKGNAVSTIPHYVKANPGVRLALLNLDFDTYDATAAALEYLYPLVVPGGIIIFDEYGVRGFGESDAVDEFFRHTHVDLRVLPWTQSPTAYVEKSK